MVESTSQHYPKYHSETSSLDSYDANSARAMQMVAQNKQYSETNADSNYSVYDAYKDTIEMPVYSEYTGGGTNSYDYSGIGHYSTSPTYGSEDIIEAINLVRSSGADLGSEILDFTTVLEKNLPTVANGLGNIAKGAIDVGVQGLITCGTACCIAPLRIVGNGIKRLLGG